MTYFLPALATTERKGPDHGWIIVSSTPWNQDSYFYQAAKSKELEKEWSRHHITWEAPVAEGLIKREFIEKVIL